jgi:23S rRNA pseudouridine2605 synthase
VRLQRFLAQAGIASRRRSEELILAGRVAVNGQIVRELGREVDPTVDSVSFDGERLVTEERVWILLNKPDSVVSTASDPEGRKTVLDLVGSQGARLYPVGRLDYHTEGVILLTNDGELAHKLMHPSSRIPRVYEVKLRGIVDPEDLDRLRAGVTLDTGEKVVAQNVHVLGTTERNTWIEITIAQGLNRQIHRMIECIGGTVLRLIRVSYAGLTVKGLRPGHYRALTQAELDELRAAVKLKGETVRSEAAPPGRRARSRKQARPQPGQERPRRDGKPRARHADEKPRARRADEKPRPSRRGVEAPHGDRAQRKGARPRARRSPRR